MGCNLRLRGHSLDSATTMYAIKLPSPRSARRRNAIAGRETKSDARLRMHYAINYCLSLCFIQSRQVTIGERINPRRQPRNVCHTAHVHAIIVNFEEETRNGREKRKISSIALRFISEGISSLTACAATRINRRRQSNGRPLHNSALQ